MAEEAARSNPDFPPELALNLVKETATATLRLMAEAKMNPDEVIRRVARPPPWRHDRARNRSLVTLRAAGVASSIQGKRRKREQCSGDARALTKPLTHLLVGWADNISCLRRYNDIIETEQ
jgi:hypothetical protein